MEKMAEKIENKNQNFETDLTVFKLCCYYSHRPNGLPWDYTEIAQEKNKKYHDSHDFILTPKGYITRHDIAYNKLLNHMVKHEKNIISCLLFLNVHYEKKQYLIGKFFKNPDKNQFVQPMFKELPDKTVYFDYLLGNPLAEWPLIHRNLTKNIR